MENYLLSSGKQIRRPKVYWPAFYLETLWPGSWLLVSTKPFVSRSSVYSQTDLWAQKRQVKLWQEIPDRLKSKKWNGALPMWCHNIRRLWSMSESHTHNVKGPRQIEKDKSPHYTVLFNLTRINCLTLLLYFSRRQNSCLVLYWTICSGRSRRVYLQTISWNGFSKQIIQSHVAAFQ